MVSYRLRARCERAVTHNMGELKRNAFRDDGEREVGRFGGERFWRFVARYDGFSRSEDIISDVFVFSSQ